MTEQVPVPAVPAIDDPCNASGVTYNAKWRIPEDTESVVWELMANGDLVASTTEGYEFENGTTSHNFGRAIDDGKVCDVTQEIPVPATPGVYDLCNMPGVTYNAHRLVPADTDQYYWSNTADQYLTVYAKPGYTFPNGALSFSYGQAPEKGSFCAGGTA